MSRILVAEDDQEQLELRQVLLEAAGHEVEPALDPHETMRRLQQSATDLVIMDLRFPNAQGTPDSAEGRALIRGIREMGCRVIYPHVPPSVRVRHPGGLALPGRPGPHRNQRAFRRSRRQTLRRRWAL